MANFVLKIKEIFKLKSLQVIFWWSVGWGIVLLLTSFWLMPRPLELLSLSGVTQPGLEGLYDQERSADFSYRWTRPRWEINLPGAGEQAYLLRIEAYLEAERMVQVLDSRSGAEVGWFRPVNEWRTYSLEIPSGAASGGQLALTFQSPNVPEPNSAAPRDLGIVIRRVSLEARPFIPLWLVGCVAGFIYFFGLLIYLVRATRWHLSIVLGLATSLVLWSVALWQTNSLQQKFNLGAAELSPYLTGFYAPEQNAGFAFRWSFPNWRLRLPLATNSTLPPETVEVRLSGLSHFGNPVEVFSPEGKLLASFTPALHWQEYNLTIPTDSASSGWLDLIFRSEGTITGNRELGLLLTDLAVRYPPEWTAIGLAKLSLGIMMAWLLIGFGLTFKPLHLTQRQQNLFFDIPFVILLNAVASLPGFIPSLVYSLENLLLYGGVATILVYSWLPLTILASRLKLPWLSTPFWTTNRTMTKEQGLILIGLVFLGAVGRVWNLSGLSIFVDEAFHAKAALDILERPANSQLFALAVDGKVLHSWLLAGIFGLTPPDSLLLVARLISVLCGLITILVCYKLGERLMSPEVGLISAGLWAVLPFAIWHERQALVDPLLTTCGGLTFYFTLRALEAGQLRYILLTGLALTAAILTKTSAGLLLFVPGLAFGFFRFGLNWRKNSLPGLIYAISWLLLLPIGWLYNGKWAVGQQQEKLSTSPDMATFTKNLGLLTESLWSYFTPLLFLVAIFAIWLACKKSPKVAWFGLLASLLPLLILCLAIKTTYPRYFLMWLVPLIPVIAVGVLEMLRGLAKADTTRRFAIGLVLIIFLAPGWFSFQLITAPERAALPPVDRFQYIEGWPAGGNLEKLAADLRQIATNQPITVLCIDTGTYSSLATYFYKQPGIRLELLPFGFTEKVQGRTALALQSGPTYLALVDTTDFFLTNKVRTSLPLYEFRPAWQAERPGKAYQLIAYTLTKK